MKEKLKNKQIKTAHKVSEKLATPLSPLGLADQAKTIAEATTGKKSWIIKHSTDIAILLGTIWSLGRILYFYYPDRPWTIWVKIIDTFLPIGAIILAFAYRLYPKINVVFPNNLTKK